MTHTLGTIAEHLRGTIEGDASLRIERVRGFEQAGEHEIAVVWDPRFHGAIRSSAAAALVLPSTCPVQRENVIRVADAQHALAALVRLFAETVAPPIGIHPEAHVAGTARIGTNVFIAPGAFVGEHVVLEDQVQIHANSVVGEHSVIGAHSVLHPNVTLYPRTQLGKRVVIHAGSVIGADGFGYVRLETGLEKIPQVGIVVIEDDVEIGANCTIDRATLEVTCIRAGTKIDNLVQVGHNSEIGRNVLLVAQVGISGSVIIDDGASLGGQVGVADHVRIGPGVAVGAQAGVHSSIASGEWLGTPAIPRERAGRMFAALPHLPDYRERVRTLESKVEALETMLRRMTELVDSKTS